MAVYISNHSYTALSSCFKTFMQNQKKICQMSDALAKTKQYLQILLLKYLLSQSCYQSTDNKALYAMENSLNLTFVTGTTAKHS